MSKDVQEKFMGPSKGKPKTGGSYESRVTKGTGSGNADLDSYAGKVSQSSRGLTRINQNTGSPAKKGTGPKAPPTGGNPLSGNLVGKTGRQLPSVSKTKNAKGENRQTY